MVDNEQIKTELDKLCRKEGILKYRFLATPYNDKPEESNGALETTVIYDEEGLLRNVAQAKNELVYQIMDELALVSLSK